MVTAYQVQAMAVLATFYVTLKGLWLRVVECNHDNFFALDENTLEQHTVQYSAVSFDGEEAFYELTKMKGIEQWQVPT